MVMVTRTSPEPEPLRPEWMARFVADIPSAVAVFDRDLRYVVANNRWLNAFGIVADGLVGQCRDQFGPHGAPPLAELHRRAMSGEAVETILGHEDPLVDGGSHRIVSARPHRDHEGGILGVVATLHETAAVASEKSLQHLTDALTGLAGRHGFMARVSSAIAPHAGLRRPAAIFLLDIDNFKGVNDLYGASSGDAVLRVIANRLLAGTRSRQATQTQLGRHAVTQRTDMVA